MTICGNLQIVIFSIQRDETEIDEKRPRETGKDEERRGGMRSDGERQEETE